MDNTTLFLWTWQCLFYKRNGIMDASLFRRFFFTWQIA